MIPVDLIWMWEKEPDSCPEDWEKSYGGTEKNDGNENREDENLMEDSSVWAGTENGQEDSARWSSDFQAEEVHSPEENSVGNGNTAAENSGGSEERYEFQEPDIRENENPGITIVNEANLTETPVPQKRQCRQNHRFSHRHWRQVHLQYRLRD